MTERREASNALEMRSYGRGGGGRDLLIDI